jgi:hypothetical protein
MFPVLFGLSPVKTDHKVKILMLFAFGLALIILVGLRHEVGGDWAQYLQTISVLKNTSNFIYGLANGEVGYQVVQWVSIKYFNGIYTVNLICAIFFTLGLIRFSKNLPLPWVALVVSIPVLILIVSMGYTRQGAAVGFLMWGLVELINRKRFSSFIFLLVGSLFHVTLVAMLPIVLLYGQSIKRYVLLSVLFLSMVLSVYFLLSDVLDRLIFFYILEEVHKSSGSNMRVLLNFIPAILFFLYKKEYRKKYCDGELWLIFSIASIALFLGSFFYSTVADRISMYFIPLQLVVFSRIPTLISSRYSRTVFVLAVVIMYISILFVWLFFGKHSNSWLPYQNFLMI